jgi:ribosomal protein S18 acetylase RimI-like enzyme
LKIRSAHKDDREQLKSLVAQFRVELGMLHERTREPDLKAAAREIAEYEASGFMITVAEEPEAKLVGYLVCRVNDGIVWAESLYVAPELRRRGVASALYAEAEKLAREIGCDTVYNWVHPNNDRIIAFLRKRGYGVLNLIELCGARPEASPTKKIRVGEHEFDY